LNKTKEILIVFKYLKKGIGINYSATPYPGPWKLNNDIKHVKYRK